MRDEDPAALEVTTTEANPSGGWIAVHYRGLAPEIDGFRLAVTDADRAAVEYPRGDRTSLENDALLVDGEIDVARFHVGDTAAPGSVLELSTSYRRAGEIRTVTHQLTVAVTRS